MAANAVVGALRVVLGLDSAKFEAGAKKAKGSGKSLATSLRAAFKSVATAVTIATAAVVAMAAAIAAPVMRAANSMDALSKAAQKVGIGAEDLAKLQYAAGLAGVEAKGLETGLARLNIALADMGKKAAPEASRALAALGITTGTTTLDALKQLADRFQQLPDGVAKSAAAVKILGRSGADLIPLLNGGSAGIAALADEAQRFGLVIDTQTARAAEQFNDNMSRMGLLAEGAGRQFAAGIIPTLVVLTNKLMETANTGPAFLEFGKNVGRALVSVAEAAFVVKETIMGVVNAIGSLGRAAVALYTGGISAASKVILDQENETSAAIDARRALFAELRKDIDSFKPGAGNTISGSILPENLEAPIAKAEKAAKGLRDEIDRIIGSSRQLTSQLRPETLAASFAAAQGSIADFSGMDIDDLIQKLPDFSNGLNKALESANRFGESLSANIGQALVFGQSLGGALVSSLKAAAAEAVTSGLFRLLTGGSGGGGGLLGGLLTSIPFFANGTGPGGAPGGLAMVGERGRELVRLPKGAQVSSNGETERMLNGGGGNVSRVEVDVQPSPLFVTTVRQATESAAVATVSAFARQSRRPGIAGAF